ncbi:DUF134 domain-containing protein [Variovorax sp. PCZ-1]|uniref:DUF134 domain-containing protein n=1 Tax=Variovorax sp. PCZ-1 TaxID=2835533 RepID=UPI001BD0721A|nr:DUF134 domain-containing protein [Variovorax sp. PCZ-1]MBS7807608.1 DUF134 domain-containing protein [Variovorax sp. PCZ-1]
MASKQMSPQVVEALKLVDDEGMSIYAAAKQIGIQQGTLYSAFNRRKLRILEARMAGLCEKCGAPVDAHGKFAQQTG